MTTVYYISHPDVVIDPAVPIPDWDLSELGRQRLEILLSQPWITSIQAVYCSDEQKAKTTARRIASHLGLQAHILVELGEIDRSATGYLPREELEPVVAALYAHPEQSIRGWERASDAQRRIVDAIERILSRVPEKATIAIVGHGGVGTLLLNHIKGKGISRADAPSGQGYYYAFVWEPRRLIHAWKPIDVVESSTSNLQP
jgi:broad specificity phosphatase PhoE